MELRTMDVERAFLDYWVTAPVFPIPEEHERHKIAAKTAFHAGYLTALRKLTDV